MNDIDSGEIIKLEAAIYNAYYKMFPSGDARFSLWPKVIKAKQAENPIEALNEILKRYVENETKTGL
jgi:hypothetical protein